MKGIPCETFLKSKLQTVVFRELNEFTPKFRGQSHFLCCRSDSKKVQNPKVSRRWIFWKVVIKFMRQLSMMLNYWFRNVYMRSRLEFFAEQ